MDTKNWWCCSEQYVCPPDLKTSAAAALVLAASMLSSCILLTQNVHMSCSCCAYDAYGQLETVSDQFDALFSSFSSFARRRSSQYECLTLRCSTLCDLIRSAFVFWALSICWFSSWQCQTAKNSCRLESHSLHGSPWSKAFAKSF